MEKNKLNVIIAGCLVTICILLFVKNILFPKSSVHSPKPAVAAEASISGNLSSLVNMRQNDAIYREQWKRWEGDWGRDPFMPEMVVTAAPVVTETEHLVLQGIFWDDEHPKAILNDKMFSKGDTLGTYTVIEIKPRSVILSAGGKNIEVQVFNSISPEKPPANQAP